MARNYKQEYAEYQGTSVQKKNRAKRNKARRQETKLGKVRKGDGMDVNHIKPLINGGSTSLTNLNIQTEHNNRSFKRTKKAKLK